MLSNYAFLGWIANLGVVPLFSFAFFLFAPALFVFCFLMLRVCVVFDAIVLSLNINKFEFYKQTFLSRILLLVKIFLMTNFYIHTAHAARKDIFLAKGEQFELTIQNLKSFSVGNKEVIKYKHLPSKNKILIKGQQLGFSDLVLWTSQSQKEVYHFYITSKQEQLKKMELAQILKDTQLETKISGDMIYIHGTVLRLNTYFLVQKLKLNPKSNIIFDIKLDPPLTAQIISKVYNDFYSAGGIFITCEETNTLISCQFKSNKPLTNLIQHLTEQYSISFKSFEELKEKSNFSLKFKIVNIESDAMSIRNSELSKIETRLSQLFSKGHLFQDDSIILQDKNLSISLLAEPELNIVFNRKFKIQLGGEIPIQVQKKENIVTEWKFVGLEITGELKLQKNNFFLNYQSFMTKTIKSNINGESSDSSISGPKGESSIFIKPEKLIKLYAIDFQRESKENEESPFFSEIPILKNLFQKQNEQFTHKRVIVYAYLEEN